MFKEKELSEIHLKNELKSMREKLDQSEVSCAKMQAELDIALSKVHEANLDSERYAISVHAIEEQLSVSEKKRDDLKQEAQETIKL